MKLKIISNGPFNEKNVWGQKFIKLKNIFNGPFSEKLTLTMS